jgi:acyl transferase domain-containing protein
VRQAYANAGITDFNATAYIECHGTGTNAGDPQEVGGIASVFAKTRDPERPLVIGSVRDMVLIVFKMCFTNFTTDQE